MSRWSLVGDDGLIEEQYRYLLAVMALPLVDGVFLSLAVSGGLSSILDALLVGFFVLGGFATVGVILSEFEGDRTELTKNTILITGVVGVVAVLQALFAPSIAGVIDNSIFRYGAMIALLVVALKILPTEKTDGLIGPTPFVVLFLILSIRPSQVTATIQYDIMCAAYAGISVLVAMIICVLTVQFKDRLNEVLDTKTLKYATAVGLIAIMLAVAGVVPETAPTVAFIGLVFSIR